MPDHDSMAVSNRCVVSLTRNAISPAISLATAFNYMVGSHFSNSSIRALYSISTVSILSAIAFACMATFCMFSSMGPSDSTCMSQSSEHNSMTIFLMLASSFCRSAVVTVAFQYLLSMSSHSCLSTAFSSLTIYSLSLASSVICACNVFNVSDGITAKSSYTAPSCNPSCTPSCAASLRILIGVTSMNLW